MPSLRDAQTNFIDTINDGPDRLDPALFAGAVDRVMLGLKAHANTISHARIVALEETFPLTRQHLGDAIFNKIAREHVETAAARVSDPNRIGLHFPDILDDVQTIELAKIEWAWLESYHAAEAVPLTLADLGLFDESSLLALCVARHPAAQLVPVTQPIAEVLAELAGRQPAAILTVRPDAGVRLVALTHVEMAVFEAAHKNVTTLGNLLTIAVEQAGEADPLGPVVTLIGAGALVVEG